jgi:hypothetical protein
MTAAAQLIKPVTLELGGKSPIIVFDDADVEKAVEWAMFGAFWTNGQICSATSRLLLHVWFSESHSSHFMVLDIWYISHSMIFYSSKKL